MKIKNEGFSLVELLVVLAVIAILLVTSITSYNKAKRKSYENWAKAELSAQAGFMRTAYGADEAYHQYLYQMGYRPQGVYSATVGIPSSPSSFSCCDRHSILGSVCEGGFLFYNCQNTAPNNLTDNLSICDHFENDPAKQGTCIKKGALSALSATPFTGLALNSACRAQDLSGNPSGAWCNCDEYTLAAITHYGSSATNLLVTDKGYFTLNQSGVLCEARQATNLNPQARPP